MSSVAPERLPRRAVAGADLKPDRLFPDALPIGCARDDEPDVFLYLVNSENPLEFRGFLHRHYALLRVLPRWEIRLLVPTRLATSVRRFVSAAIEELASPIALAEPPDLRWYLEQQRLVNAGCASHDPTRFAALRRAFAVQRYRALYRTWQDTGDSSLYEATSPLLSTAMEVEEGRVTRHVLPHDYLCLTTLVGTA